MYFFVHSALVLRRWKTLSTDARCDLELVLDANHVLIINEQRNSVHVTPDMVWLASCPEFENYEFPHLRTLSFFQILLMFFLYRNIDISKHINC